MINRPSRRDFLKSTVLAGGGFAAVGQGAEVPDADPGGFVVPAPAKLAETFGREEPLPSPEGTRWIWYPSNRTLANTMVLFRRALDLASAPRRATGWITRAALSSSRGAKSKFCYNSHHSLIN